MEANEQVAANKIQKQHKHVPSVEYTRRERKKLNNNRHNKSKQREAI